MLVLLAALSLHGAMADAMRGLDGAAIAADASTGRVLAQTGGTKVDTRWAAPGSALKPFTLAVLIEQGAGDSRIACRGRLEIAGRRLDCSHPRLAAPLTAAEALAYSCNSWFARAASRADPAKLAARLREFGFQAAPPNTEDERALQAIGEFGVTTTPSALLNSYRRLLALKGDPRYSPVFEGLEGAVEFGSAQLASVAGMKTAGKTGTTPNASRTDTHAWFAGYAPADKPAIVVAVFLESGKGGPSAAPIAARIFSAGMAQTRSQPRPGSSGRPALRSGNSRYVVRVRGGRVIEIGAEEYVAAALAGEAASFPGEALKAMAVAARTFAAANRGRHKPDGWDFCDTSHCQNLRPDSVTARLEAAVEATDGQLLWYAGKLAQSFYHRHCGGTTEAAAALWPALAAPYLKQQADTFCLSAGKAPWRVEVERRRVEIVSRTPSGRVAQLRVDGRVLPLEAVQGELRLVSAFFDVRSQGDRVIFEGFGAGHGAGMCQTGAAERARQGHNWRQILDFYYPGTKPGLTAQGLQWSRRGGERIEMFTTQPQGDAALLEAAERALREAERRSGIAHPARVRLRVYPAIAAFRDATGEPGWVSASTRGDTVRLQPAAQLLARGVLESTLLHEMLHIAVEQRAHPRLPGWFREGVVLWLADPNKPASGLTAREVALERAGSEAELRRAYEAARSRVMRLVATHGRGTVLSWIERGVPSQL